MTKTHTTEELDRGNEVRWKLYRELDWIVVRADEVKSGDLYANGATVTASRKANKRDQWGDDERFTWTIVCGKGFKHGGRPDQPIVVGRRRPRGT